MKSLLRLLAAALLAVITIDGVLADGSRSRAYRYRGIGAISHNVITPWYYGYYPTHYSYFAPDPMPRVQAIVIEDCWRWGFPYRYWACW